MATPVLGIDLGTTNSVVSYADESGLVSVIADESGDRIIPSVVHFEQDGNVVVGRLARGYAKVEPQRVARIFKRGMGTSTFLKNGASFEVDGKAWTPEELSSLILKKLRNMGELHFEGPATKAVITVPYYFGEPERAATRSAGEIAGLEVLQIVNEPTAAAIVHGVEGEPTPGKLLVFDLGGGTFDVTIMRYGESGDTEVVATSGDRELGGADFDEAILEKMIEIAQAETGQDLTEDPWTLNAATELAEEIKQELSTRESATRPLPISGKPLMFTLSRGEFEELIAERIELVEDAILNALDRAEVDGSEIDDVLMVGGSSRIPVFQQMVERITGAKPKLTKNLDEDVSRGAALLGAKLGDSLDPRSELANRPTPVDAASHALGIAVLDEESNELINQVVIAEGTPIPHSSTHPFAAASEGQKEVALVLNEGADRDLDFVRELGKSMGRLAEPVHKGHPLRCEIQYNADQLIEVQLFDGVSGQLLAELSVEHEGMLSDQERADAREFLQRAEVS
ncbi:MAG TPA: Hsp70 family protein [Solirubrobacterales bacterium]|jgi:molecular chaperone DnaK|nr:Hsp70 family protein [Solirubrobacterales bacterium]